MREQEGAEGNHKFIRLLLLHREVGMDILTSVLLQAEKAQIYRYEAVHESMQGILNSQVIIRNLPIDKTPINLLDYKVKKSNVEQYAQLTRGKSI